MSDLLPLVAAILKDKAAAEAQEELVVLRRELDVSRSVEIVRAGSKCDDDREIKMYATGQFQDGAYGCNPNLWRVNFEPGSVTCPLSDLRDCRICVGGGVTLESLDDTQPNRADFEGFMYPDEDDGDNSKAVSFCFCPNSLWLTVVVHGWPRDDWEEIMEDSITFQTESISILVEMVAVKFPKATVRFKSVSFVLTTVEGALKRLLPLKRKEEVRAERDGRDNNESRDYAALMHFVASTMRERGNDNNSPVFFRQVNEVLDILLQLGIRKENEDNEDTIINIIRKYETVGREGIEAIIQRAAGNGDGDGAGDAIDDSVGLLAEDREGAMDDDE